MTPAERPRAGRAIDLWITGVALGLASCTPLVVSAPPAGVERILVLPACNQTGEPLFVDAPVVLPSVFGERPRATVADLFTREAILQLRERGFEVAEPSALGETAGLDPPKDAREAARIAASSGFDGAALYIEISRWDPDEHSRPSYVTAKVGIALLDPESGEVLWEARWPAKPVSAGMTGSVSLAYPVAVRELLAAMTATLEPASDGGETGTTD